MAIIFLFLTALVLLYLGSGGATAIALLAAVFLAVWYLSGAGLFSLTTGSLLLIIFALLVLPNKIRRERLSRPILAWVRTMLPKLSETEAEALKSGSVDWDGELFSGHPNW